MRNFLTNINIVGAVMCCREEELLKYCIDNLITLCNHIVIVLDNYNQRTKEIILEYQNNNPEFFTVAYSKIERSNKADESRIGFLKSRLVQNQGRIRQQMVEEIKKVHDKKKVDILIWPDSDEVFTNYFPTVLKKFWHSDKNVLFTGFITIYDNFQLARTRTMIPHARVYKYRSELSAQPYRGRTFYHPYTGDEIMSMHHILVHLPLINDKRRDYRMKYVFTRTEASQRFGLCKLPKDVRDMSPDEYVNFIKNRKIDFTIEEYEKKKN